MECPHCKQDLQLDNAVIPNVTIYHNNALAKTLCCGRPVMVSPKISVMVHAWETNRVEDDWGYEFDK